MLQEEPNELGIQFTEHAPRVRRSPFISMPILLPQFGEHFHGVATDRKSGLPLLRPLPVAYSIAPYASIQKSVKTFGGSGESIMRCVKRMPIIPSAGSV